VGLVRAAENADTPLRVRAREDAALETLSARLRAGTTQSPQAAALRREIAAHFARPRDAAPAPATALPPPPGDPIGGLGDCSFGSGS